MFGRYGVRRELIYFLTMRGHPRTQICLSGGRVDVLKKTPPLPPRELEFWLEKFGVIFWAKNYGFFYDLKFWSPGGGGFKVTFYSRKKSPTFGSEIIYSSVEDPDKRQFLKEKNFNFSHPFCFQLTFNPFCFSTHEI